MPIAGKYEENGDKQALSRLDLRELVLAELRDLGFSLQQGQLQLSGESKEYQRTLHAPACHMELEKARKWINAAWPKYKDFFADGGQVTPGSIAPQLVEVTSDFQRDLFRLARYTWSLPYTKGYGRRLQYLILDGNNEKLIGILGLQSPPLSLPARDQLYKYPDSRKTELINQTMDIYTLGAVQPYARLLGGKLVALLALSNEIRAAYQRKYNGRETEMEKRILPPNLVALTTTSAFGRSSILNRLRYRDNEPIMPIGYTDGYGAFHLERLYPQFRVFLEQRGKSTRGGFGKGPRLKWQTMVRALHEIGFDGSLLHHGVLRQVFLFGLIRNLKQYMEGAEATPQYIDAPARDLIGFWLDRWLLPRASRVDGWHKWKKDALSDLLIVKSSA
jgi:hypothetical protein